MKPNREFSDAAVRSWLESIGIPVVDAVDRSWSGSEANVVRVTSADGGTFYVKQFESTAKFRQEAEAYQKWLGDFVETVPRLVAVDSQNQMLLLTDLGDSYCHWRALPAMQQSALMQQAGRFLRKLHHLRFVDKDSMRLGDAVLARAVALRETVKAGEIQVDNISAKLMNQIVADITEILPLLNQIERVPCHRDFWSRNWIWSKPNDSEWGDLHLGVIDFEHARPDLFVFDFMKLWSDCWIENPELQEPFWQGYGRVLSASEQVLQSRCAAVHAVQTILWAIEHHNPEFAAQGERLLADVMGRDKSA